MMRIHLAALCAVLACGQGDRQFHLQLASNDASGASDALPSTQMQAGETRIIELLVVGPAPGAVTFSGDNLPSFASLNGPLLTLAPARADAGEYTLTLKATAAHHTEDASLHLTVTRQNAPPTLSSSAYMLTDEKGMHFAGLCPGPECTLFGTPQFLVPACDPDGDAVTVEVEVVREGQPFRGVPTYTATGPACGTIPVPMPGLAPNQGYAFAFRVSDAFGVQATTPMTATPNAAGWYTALWGPLRFDVGPCATWQCGCVPAEKPAEAAYQCCSGAAGPYSGPEQGFYNVTCH